MKITKLEAIAFRMPMRETVKFATGQLSALDHVLVRATIGGETLWLDGTGSGARYEDLRDTPFWHVYFEIVEIVPAVENAYMARRLEAA